MTLGDYCDIGQVYLNTIIIKTTKVTAMCLRKVKEKEKEPMEVRGKGWQLSLYRKASTGDAAEVADKVQKVVRFLMTKTMHGPPCKPDKEYHVEGLQ